MPLPMVHLLLDNILETKLERQSDPYFLLGSIAPDSIHARPGTTRRDKHVTHLFSNGHGDTEAINANVANVLQVLKETDKNDEFTKGYCIHTMLDMMWINKVFNVLARTLRAGGINFNDVRNKYYEETDVCDLYICNNMPWIPGYRELLCRVKPVGFMDLLAAEEVGLWRDEVIGKIDRYNGRKLSGYIPHYITYNLVYNFVDGFAQKIINDFKSWEIPL